MPASAQMMDLHAFPFDLQKLEIMLRLPHRADMGRTFTQFHNHDGSAQASSGRCWRGSTATDASMCMSRRR